MGQLNGRFQAATLFVDISGFTAVTEKLMQHGKVGAEMLADVMQAIFTPLIEAVYQRGGYINGFAGDAFTAIFPGRGVRAKSRAVDAAWAMRSALSQFETVKTPLGTFAFAGRVGVASGSVNWGIVGNAERRTAYFRGAAIDRCAEAEHIASDGEVVLTQEVAAVLANKVVTTPRGAFVRLETVSSPLSLGNPALFLDEGNLETAAAFRPRALLTTPVKGEFRQVITVFVNLKDNPPPARLKRFMRRCFALLGQYDGYLCRLDFGDKGCNLLLFWGAPTSHENDIERALNFLLRLADKSDISLRAGVSLRQAFAGFCGSYRREEYTCYGLSVNQAARQMLQAPWGEIWLDRQTARRAEQFETTLVDQFHFKGFAEPQAIFRLDGRRERSEPFYQGSFVGRHRELRQLEAALQPLRQNCFGGITVITGESGIGKSRLAHYFIDQIAPKIANATPIICQTDEILRRMLNPFRYALLRAFGQTNTQTVEQNKSVFFQKLHDLMAAVTDDALRAELARTHTFLGALMDLHWEDSLYTQLSPELRLENTLLALKTWLRAESQIRPLLMLIEDAQWLDETSRHFIQQLAFGLEQYPIAVWLTSRREETLSLFSKESAITHLSLSGLTEANVVEVTQRRLGQPPSPALLKLLQERAEGNPFYLEQLLLYLQEQELLRHSRDKVTVNEAEKPLPQDVQTVLVARLDRLTHDVRQVVQTAAVLGREFEVQVLSHMLQNRQDIAQHVQEAEKATVWAPLNEVTYLFHHALLRDAAYAMQLETQLRALHLTAARSLETLYADNLTRYAEEIGYHYEEAGEVDTAVPYWRQAAQNSQQTYQNDRAITLYNKLLEHPHKLNNRDIVDINLQKAHIFNKFVGDFEQAETALLHAQAKAELEKDELLLCRVLNRFGQMYHDRGTFEEAQKHLLRSERLLEKYAPHAEQAVAFRELGNVSEGFGDYNKATGYYQKSKEVCEALEDTWGQAQANLNLGLMHLYNGDFDEAEALYRQALRGFEQEDDLYSQCKTYNNLGSVAWGREEMDTAATFYEQAYQIGKQCGSYLVQSITLSNLGTIAHYHKQYEKSTDYYSEALRISEGVNDLYSIAHTKCNLSGNYKLEGDDRLSKQYLLDAIKLAQTIKADTLLLDCCLSANSHYHQDRPDMAYRFLTVIRAHPACHADLQWRCDIEDEKLTMLSAEQKTQIAADAANLTLETCLDQIVSDFSAALTDSA